MEEHRNEIRITKDDLKDLPARDENGNKGVFGKTLVIAGDQKICGAAYLSAKAALLSGIGMVKIYTEQANRIPLATLFPEALLETYAEETWSPEDLQDALDWADAVLIGPGIGLGKTAEHILHYVLDNVARPLVLDADALNLVSADPEMLSAVDGTCVLTPHVMEMSRLTGKSISEIKEDPVMTARAFAGEVRATVVLKDSKTVIADPDGMCWIYEDGCSALSTAGSGDVLAGLITGFMTRFRGEDLPLAALAVAAHGECGNIMAQRKSEATVIASDLFEALPSLI